MRGFITDPSAPQGLRLADNLPEPQPAPNETLVDVHAYSVNRGETRLVPARPHGWRPGQDLAGVVAAPAADGSGPPAGTRVVALVDGAAWAERVAVPTDRLAVLPDSVITEHAASLPIAGLTALRALRIDGSLLGRRVLVTGATGGVGSFALALARIAGAHVTALVHSAARVETARDLGADDVLTSLDNERIAPFHLVLDGVGGPVLVAALGRAAPRGTVVLYAGGPAAEIALSSFARAQLARLVGFFVYAEHGSTMAEDLRTLVALVEEGRLRPRVSARSWDETPDVFEALHGHRIVGKAVLIVKAR
jgi:NADPH:quinone reductase-like Zn-dependent oxidoreductase